MDDEYGIGRNGRWRQIGGMHTARRREVGRGLERGPQATVATTGRSLCHTHHGGRLSPSPSQHRHISTIGAPRGASHCWLGWQRQVASPCAEYITDWHSSPGSKFSDFRDEERRGKS